MPKHKNRSRILATDLGKSPAQVVLRRHIQRGDIIFPKSKTPERVRENFEIFDFELDGAAMGSITALDRGDKGRTGANPDTMNYGAKS
ncbi:aldo/keto reductase [Actinoplanes sp. NPDC026619]|uniref:aldo/keto reductase n=1 Tax=Actinoplanes sp. NPDC026619 TaxID=3155798 RepID=UPI00340C0B6D